jgi:hypothetical protein
MDDTILAVVKVAISETKNNAELIVGACERGRHCDAATANQPAAAHTFANASTKPPWAE